MIAEKWKEDYFRALLDVHTGQVEPENCGCMVEVDTKLRKWIEEGDFKQKFDDCANASPTNTVVLLEMGDIGHTKEDDMWKAALARYATIVAQEKAQPEPAKTVPGSLVGSSSMDMIGGGVPLGVAGGPSPSSGSYEMQQRVPVRVPEQQGGTGGPNSDVMLQAKVELDTADSQLAADCLVLKWENEKRKGCKNQNVNAKTMIRSGTKVEHQAWFQLIKRRVVLSFVIEAIVVLSARRIMISSGNCYQSLSSPFLTWLLSVVKQTVDFDLTLCGRMFFL